MDQIESSIRALTRAICHELDGVEIRDKSVWTVVTPTDAIPYVAMDVKRRDLSDLQVRLSIGLLRMPEYEAAAEAFENHPELSRGIAVGPTGYLQEPERNNVTRMILAKFLWQYLGEGELLNWDETRFDESFKELMTELSRKTVVFRSSFPLSNLKMEIEKLDFGDEMELVPASIEELEDWLNPDRSMLPLGGSWT